MVNLNRRRRNLCAFLLMSLSLLLVYKFKSNFIPILSWSKSLNPVSVLLQEKINHINTLISRAENVNTKCIKILFCHNQKAGGTTIRRFFEDMQNEKGKAGRDFKFRGVWGRNPMNKNTWETFISSERLNPMENPFLSIEVHTTDSIIYDVIPKWKSLGDIYAQHSCLAFTFTHLRKPRTHIMSVYNQNLGVKRNSNEFVAPYWHNIISCGLRNPTLNFFFKPLYHQSKGPQGEYRVLPINSEGDEALRLSDILQNEFDLVSHMKDFRGLFAILHKLYNSSACTIRTAKTSNHDMYMGEKTRVARLDAKIPIMLCKVQINGYSPSTYNSKLRKLMPKAGFEALESKLIQETYREDEKIYDKAMQLYMQVNEHIVTKLSGFNLACTKQLHQILSVSHER